MDRILPLTSSCLSPVSVLCGVLIRLHCVETLNQRLKVPGTVVQHHDHFLCTRSNKLNFCTYKILQFTEHKHINTFNLIILHQEPEFFSFADLPTVDRFCKLNLDNVCFFPTPPETPVSDDLIQKLSTLHQYW